MARMVVPELKEEKRVSDKGITILKRSKVTLADPAESVAIGDGDGQLELALQHRAQCILHRSSVPRFAAVEAWRYNGAAKR